MNETPQELSPGTVSVDAGSWQPRFGWARALIVFLVYEAGQLVGGAAVGVVAGAVLASRGIRLDDPANLAQLQSYVEGPATLLGLVLGAALMVFVTRSLAASHIRERGPGGIGWAGSAVRPIVLWAFVGVGLSIGFQVALQFEPPVPYEELGPLSQMAASGGAPRLYWVAFALMAPVVEEFLFRGVLFSGLARSVGIPAAATLVTVGFTLLHFPEAGAVRAGLPAIFLMAVATLAARVQTGALPAAIALHLAYNAVTVAGVYLGEAG